MYTCMCIYIYIYIIGGTTCATLLVHWWPFRFMRFSSCPTPSLETPTCEERPIEQVALHK